MNRRLHRQKQIKESRNSIKTIKVNRTFLNNQQKLDGKQLYGYFMRETDQEDLNMSEKGKY